MEPWNADSVALRMESGAFHTFSQNELELVEIKVGTNSGWLAGGLIGGLAGVAVGLLVMTGEDCEYDYCTYIPEVYSVATAALGFGLGALIGAAITWDVWKPVK